MFPEANFCYLNRKKHNKTAKNELKKQKKLLGIVKVESEHIKTLNGVKLDLIFPSVEQIRTAALFKPAADTLTYDSYLNGIEEGLFNVWDSAVRTGYLTGQTTNEIVRNVMGGVSAELKLKNSGLINTLRNSIYGNTRTLLQSFAAETRNRVYEANEKYFGDGGYKYEWVSALDSRTCLVCGNLDGKLFKTLKDVPAIPVHRGCRCVAIPYFDFDDLRASKNGYVESKVTFSEWLGEQDMKTQKEVLGKTRFELFKKGEPISQFVDNGKVLSLKELNERLDKKN